MGFQHIHGIEFEIAHFVMRDCRIKSIEAVRDGNGYSWHIRIGHVSFPRFIYKDRKPNLVDEFFVTDAWVADESVLNGIFNELHKTGSSSLVKRHFQVKGYVCHNPKPTGVEYEYTFESKLVITSLEEQREEKSE